eukprot:710913-Amphidinium_carterae.1
MHSQLCPSSLLVATLSDGSSEEAPPLCSKAQGTSCYRCRALSLAGFVLAWGMCVGFLARLSQVEPVTQSATCVIEEPISLGVTGDFNLEHAAFSLFGEQSTEHLVGNKTECVKSDRNPMCVMGVDCLSECQAVCVKSERNPMCVIGDVCLLETKADCVKSERNPMCEMGDDCL